MAKSLFSQPLFTYDDAARTHLEALRWPNGPICPHCGGTERNSRLQGKAHRPGLIFCGDCRTQFTVTVGTVFERSKVPLHKWVLATHLLCSSKKGISSNQLARTLGVTLKTAWFMGHRIRAAMADEPIGSLGGGGKVVEVDETYFGNVGDVRQPRRFRSKDAGRKRGKDAKLPKRCIVSLVERSGKVRSFHIGGVTNQNLRDVLFSQIDKNTHLMTDEATRYWNLGKAFAEHSSVNHSKGEYARGKVTTNTVEGFFSILKRGLIGTYHHVGERHLQRYVSEFDFRYNNRSSLGVEDEQRTNEALRGITGKRLTYRRTQEQAQA